MKHSGTPFQAWLARLGDEVAADFLQVNRRTVQSWRLGERVPRPAQARAITKKSRLTLDDIYGEPNTHCEQQG